MIPNSTFAGCRSLRMVDFKDTDQDPSFVTTLGDNFISGCTRLTSITFPKSINSLKSFEPNALYGSNLKEITLRGFSMSDITLETGTVERVTVDLGEGKWITPADPSELLALWQLALDNGVPIAFLVTNDAEDGAGRCGNCVMAKTNTFNTVKFNEFVLKSGMIFVKVVPSFNEKDGGVYYTYKNRIGHNKQLGKNLTFANYPVLDVTCAKVNPDTGEVEYNINFWINYLKLQYGPDYVINTIEKNIGDYLYGSTVSHQIISKALDYNFTGWGLSNECIIKTNDGKEITFYPGDTSSFEVEDGVHIDMLSRSNFKRGVWYGNIQELIEYADNLPNPAPVFVEYGAEACGPCTQFENWVFNDRSFQEWAKSQNILLGRFVSRSAGEATSRYITENLLNREPGVHVSPPDLICHWGTVNVDRFFSALPEGITQAQYDRALKSVDDVSAYIHKNLAGYSGTLGEPPEISVFEEVVCIPKAGATQASDCIEFSG